MAIYLIGDLIRMMREAQGMTQDQLVEIYDMEDARNKTSEKKGLKGNIRENTKENIKVNKAENISGNAKENKKNKKNKKSEENNEICSTQVLRRIEKGTVRRVKIKTFKKLMKKLGVLPEKTYPSLLVTDPRALNLKSEIHVHMSQREYDEAEKKLPELEKKMVLGYPRNEQYLMEKKATLAYKRGEISAEEYRGILWDALKYTVPMLDEIDIADWPFNMNEFDILAGIVDTYLGMKDEEGELKFLMKLKKNVEREYMDRDHYVVWHTFVLACLSQFIRVKEQWEKLEEYCAIGMEECKERRILGCVYRFLYDIAWYRENVLRKGNYPKTGSIEQQEAWIKKERVFCKEQLVQAYYVSVMAGDNYETDRIKRLCEYFYPGEIKLL